MPMPHMRSRPWKKKPGFLTARLLISLCHASSRHWGHFPTSPGAQACERFRHVSDIRGTAESSWGVGHAATGNKLIMGRNKEMTMAGLI